MVRSFYSVSIPCALNGAGLRRVCRKLLKYMEGLDLLILAVLLVGLARGVSTGGIKQVLGLAGVVLAFIAAAQFMQPAGERLVRAFGVGEHYAPAIGFDLIFLIVQGAAFLLARSLEKLLDSMELGFINRLFGGALGVFKGALLLSLLALVMLTRRGKGLRAAKVSYSVG